MTEEDERGLIGLPLHHSEYLLQLRASEPWQALIEAIAENLRPPSVPHWSINGDEDSTIYNTNEARIFHEARQDGFDLVVSLLRGK